MKGPAVSGCIIRSELSWPVLPLVPVDFTWEACHSLHMSEQSPLFPEGLNVFHVLFMVYVPVDGNA